MTLIEAVAADNAGLDAIATRAGSQLRSGGGTSSMSRATIRRAPRATTACSSAPGTLSGIWPLKARLGELQIDSQDFAHWDIEASGPNWQVSTRYEFLRQEHIIRANMARAAAAAGSARARLGVGLSRQRRDLSGAARLLGVRAALIYFQMLLIWWLVLAAAAAGSPLAPPRLLGLPVLARCCLGADRRARGVPGVAAARRPLVRGPDQQPLALSLRVRAR